MEKLYPIKLEGVTVHECPICHMLFKDEFESRQHIKICSGNLRVFTVVSAEINMIFDTRLNAHVIVPDVKIYKDIAYRTDNLHYGKVMMDQSSRSVRCMMDSDDDDKSKKAVIVEFERQMNILKQSCDDALDSVRKELQ